MATFNLGSPNTVYNLNQFLADNPTYVATDFILGGGGYNGLSTLLIDATPTKLMGRIQFSGPIIFDSTNLPAGEILYYPTLQSGNVGCTSKSENAILDIRGKWFDLATTTGAANQVIDLTGYWGSNAPDCIPAVWIETGRYIAFSNSSGLTPEVDNWIYIQGTQEPIGRIVEVGPDYIVTKFLTVSLPSGTNIVIKKLINQDGPLFKTTWSATVAADDVKADGVYQGFANAVDRGVGYLDEMDVGMRGFCFENMPTTTTLRLGGGVPGVTGGFIPPAGCNIRLPNIHFTSNQQASYDQGIMAFDGTFGAGGTFITSSSVNKASIANFNSLRFCLRDGACIKNEIDHVGYFSIIGRPRNNRPGYIKNCVGATSIPVRQEEHRQYVLMLDGSSGGYEITDNYFFSPVAARNYVGLNDLKNFTFKNNILSFNRAAVITEGTNQCISVLRADGALIENNVFLARGRSENGDQGVVFQDSLNVTFRANKINHNVLQATANRDNKTIVSNDSSNVRIEGLELIGPNGSRDIVSFGGTGTDLYFYASGEPDDPIKLQDQGQSLGYTLFLSGQTNVNFARVYIESDFRKLNPQWYAGSWDNVNHWNVGGNYDGRIVTGNVSRGRLRGVNGGNEYFGDGIRWNFNLEEGGQFHDLFWSPDEGIIFLSFIPNSSVEGNLTVISGSPSIGYGGITIGANDIVEYEQDYFAKGHTGFTGKFHFSGRSSALSFDNTNDSYSDSTAVIQYDSGSGWNGTWINMRDTAAIQAIPVDPSGIRLKVRFTTTNTGGRYITFWALGTSTTTQAKAENLYPLDQNFVPINITAKEVDGTLVPGAKVIVFAEPGGLATPGDIIINETTDANGQVFIPSLLIPQNQPYSGWVRKSSESPYYKQTPLSGTISASTGLDITAIMVPDE